MFRSSDNDVFYFSFEFIINDDKLWKRIMLLEQRVVKIFAQQINAEDFVNLKVDKQIQHAEWIVLIDDFKELVHAIVKFFTETIAFKIFFV